MQIPISIIVACIAWLPLQGFAAAPKTNSPRIQESDTQEKNSIKKPAKFDYKTVTGSTFFERVLQTPPVKSTNQADTKGINAYGIILDSEKKPVSNAIVIVRNGHAMSAGGANSINDVYAKTKTDSEGRYKFEDVRMRSQYKNPEIVAFTETGEMGWNSAHQADLGTPKKIDVTLNKSVPLKCKVVDDQGDPIQGVVFTFKYLWNHANESSDSYAGYSDRVISPISSSNENGEISFPTMPAGFVTAFQAVHPDYASKYFSILTTDAHPGWVNDPRNTRIPIKSNGDTLTLEKGVMLTLKIVDEKSKPIIDATVNLFGISKPTDSGGVFKSACPTAYIKKKEELRCRISHKQYGHLAIDVSTAELVAGTAVVTLFEPAEITGKIAIKGTDKPIPGLSIKLDSTGPSLGRTARTNEDGIFTISKMSKGNITLKVFGRVPGLNLVPEDYRSIDPEEYQNLIRKFALKPGEKKELETIYVEKVKPVSVSVIDKNGDPMVGARIRLLSYVYDYSELKPNSEWATTEMDGGAELLPFAASDESLVEASFESEEGIHLGEAIVERGQTAQVKLLVATEVRGKITVNGKPIAGVELHISKAGEQRAVLANGNGVLVSGSRNIGKCVTDEKGEYVLPVMKNDGLGKPAAYYVGVRSGIPNKTAFSISGKAKLTDGIHVSDKDFFQGESKVGGTVVDANGDPFPQIKVMVRMSLTGRYLSPFDLFLPSYAHTDASGKFLINGLPKGKKFRIGTGASSRLRIPWEESKKYAVEVQANSEDTNVKIVIPIDQNPDDE